MAAAAQLAAGCAAPPSGAPAPATVAPADSEDNASGLLPDVGGPLRTVVLSVNSARRAALRNASLVTNLVNALSAETRVLVLANDLGAFTVARDDVPGRVRFLELPFENPITIWPQDPFLVLHNAGHEGPSTRLLVPRSFDRAGDGAMAARVAAETGFVVVASSLFFEGGNIVSDRERILVGDNTIRYNAVELGLDPVEVVLRFEQELGRPVLVVGPFPQPVAHLDMVVTPLGDGRIAVADAAAGADLAERELAADPASVEAFERACEAGFFGHPAIHEVPGPGGEPTLPPRVLGRTDAMAARSRDIAPDLDGVADALAGAGYEVLRIPFLFGGALPADAAPAATSSEPPEPGPTRSAGYPVLTYNNVLLEDRPSGPLVYLPRYGWPALDRAAATAWREAGFAPRPIDGLTASAMYGGALRCTVKVLERQTR